MKRRAESRAYGKEFLGLFASKGCDGLCALGVLRPEQ